MATTQHFPKHSLKKHFDVAIIGGNLTGAILARQLCRTGHSVTIIEKQDSLVAHLKPQVTQNGEMPPGFYKVPHRPESQQALDWISEQLETGPLYEGVLDSSPVTYMNSELKAFLGFGDRRCLSIEGLSYYNTSSWLNVTLPPEDLRQKVVDNLDVEVFVGCEVTDFIVVDEKIQSATINGDHSLFANQFIFCLSPAELLDLVPPQSLSHRLRQRLAKAVAFSQVSLHFSHNQPICAEEKLHFLMGGKDDFEPCLGYFFLPPKPETNTQHSVWITLIPSEHQEDNEYISNTIRNMKKQIKRAYPEALENLSNEKIVVTGDTHGFIDLKLKEPHPAELSNLILSSPLLNPAQDLVAHLLEAQKTWLFLTNQPLEDEQQATK